MPIPITCEYCEESYRITDKAAGKRIRCKECGEAIDVPGSATMRSTSGASRVSARNRSDSAGTGSRSSRPARSGSKQRASQSGSHISNRRERANGDDQTRNLIVGVCIAAVSLIGGGAFLVFGRGDSQADRLAQATFEAQKEAHRRRMDQEAAAFRADSRRQSQRIVDENRRMIDGLNRVSSNMGAPDMTPPNMTQPGMESPNTAPGMPPGMPPYAQPGSTPPGFEPPTFGGRTGGRRGGRTGNRSGAIAGRRGGTVGGAFGGAFGGVPLSAESDADLAALEQAMKSDNRAVRLRAMGALGRSSRKVEAAKILAENITERDETSIVHRLGGMGDAGESHLLKLLQAVPEDQFARAVPILTALGRCGTEKSIPVLEKFAKSGSPAAALAKSSLSLIRSKP